MSNVPEISPKPCVGSGLCCLKARCWVGVRIYGPGGGCCPALVWRDGRYWCGEITSAEKAEQERLKKELYVGDGCCMSLFNNLRDERFRSMTEVQRLEYQSAALSLSRSYETLSEKSTKGT